MFGRPITHRYNLKTNSFQEDTLASMERHLKEFYGKRGNPNVYAHQFRNIAFEAEQISHRIAEDIEFQIAANQQYAALASKPLETLTHEERSVLDRLHNINDELLHAADQFRRAEFEDKVYKYAPKLPFQRVSDAMVPLQSLQLSLSHKLGLSSRYSPSHP